ncbi:MAG TPA: CopG family transcriptional regulator [Candidatus Acidoferrum sp.]|nr:CopG family transcriptional regulator [Candidatus Acidoferrum sp.]
MRTTLDIEEDVMKAIKELAKREGITAGSLVSTLLRKALTHPGPGPDNQLQEPAAFYGFRPFPSTGKIVTNEDVNKLRDELGI